jgi:anthranilate phosphoribosyltransferase
MVALNAGATIYSADLVDSLEAGVVRAQEILSAGTGLEKLEALVAFTQRFSETN